nr:FAD-dependent oxidoreductase [Arthrobacter sp. StoSoilA2]
MLAPAVGQIHWAGAQTTTVWSGYMDGAARSGRRAAEPPMKSSKNSRNRRSHPPGRGVGCSFRPGSNPRPEWDTELWFFRRAGALRVWW